MSHLLSILTVRMSSDRLPGKVLAPIAGKPFLAHIIERVRPLPGELVIATTIDPCDDPIAALCQSLRVECYRHTGPVNDVVGRMAAVVAQKPRTTHVLRLLGDSPFPEVSLMSRALIMLDRIGAEIMLWYTQPDAIPLYGSRELPMARSAFDKISRLARGDEREHVDLYFNRNRAGFKLLYHEPPTSIYFRPLLRLEVDWPEDLRLVEAIAKGPGMQASLKEIVQWLDRNDGVARLNWGKVEKTGPLVSYGSSLKREWFKLMRGKPVYRWDGGYWNPNDTDDSPLFCNSGQCLVGWGLPQKGQIRTAEGHLVDGRAWLNCQCGAGRFTRERF